MLEYLLIKNNMKEVLTESELNKKIVKLYREEQLKFLSERWNDLEKHEKVFVIELYKNIFPTESKFVNEATGWNTAADIAGIFDPTGIIDLVNGISYWKQGDKLFAILSWISVFPYFGDAIAKPVVGALKLGGDTVKAFRYAAAGKDASKIAETAKSAGGTISKLVEDAPQWGVKLVDYLRSSFGKFPFLRKISGLVEEYINLFVTAGREMKAGTSTLKGLGVAEKETLKSTFKGFREYGGGNKYFKYIFKSDAPMWYKFVGGAPRLFGNAATRSLMRRTKWYLGLLDKLGIADTRTTPDELVQKYPDLEEKINEYNNTEVAQKNWTEDFGTKEGGLGDEPTTDNQPMDDYETKQETVKKDPIDILLGGIFGL